MNNKDNRVGWIRELEVGDSVVVKDKYKAAPIGYGVIQKITPHWQNRCFKISF